METRRSPVRRSGDGTTLFRFFLHNNDAFFEIKSSCQRQPTKKSYHAMKERSTFQVRCSALNRFANLLPIQPCGTDQRKKTIHVVATWFRGDLRFPFPECLYGDYDVLFPHTMETDLTLGGALF